MPFVYFCIINTWILLLGNFRLHSTCSKSISSCKNSSNSSNPASCIPSHRVTIFEWKKICTFCHRFFVNFSMVAPKLFRSVKMCVENEKTKSVFKFNQKTKNTVYFTKRKNRFLDEYIEQMCDLKTAMSFLNWLHRYIIVNPLLSVWNLKRRHWFNCAHTVLL